MLTAWSYFCHSLANFTLGFCSKVLDEEFLMQDKQKYENTWLTKIGKRPKTCTPLFQPNWSLTNYKTYQKSQGQSLVKALIHKDLLPFLIFQIKICPKNCFHFRAPSLSIFNTLKIIPSRISNFLINLWSQEHEDSAPKLCEDLR